MPELLNHDERQALYRAAKPGDGWWRAEARPRRGTRINAAYSFSFGAGRSSLPDISFFPHFVIRVTPLSVIVSRSSYFWATEANPEHFHTYKLHDEEGRTIGHSFGKRFASPTKLLAMESCIARAKRERAIYSARIEHATLKLAVAEAALVELKKAG